MLDFFHSKLKAVISMIGISIKHHTSSTTRCNLVANFLTYSLGFVHRGPGEPRLAAPPRPRTGDGRGQSSLCHVQQMQPRLCERGATASAGNTHLLGKYHFRQEPHTGTAEEVDEKLCSVETSP